MKAELIQEKIDAFLRQMEILGVNAMVSVISNEPSYICGANTENGAEGIELIALSLATGLVAMTQNASERMTICEMVVEAAESMYNDIIAEEKDNATELN